MSTNQTGTTSPPGDTPLAPVPMPVQASLICGIGLIGMFFNFISAFVLFKHRTFRNSFGIQMVMHNLCDFGQCCMFVFWVTPSIIWGISDMSFGSWVNNRVGTALMGLCMGSYFSCFAISINRVIAIGFPYAYMKIYTKQTTKIIMGVTVMISFFYASFYLTDYCSLYFDRATGFYLISDTPLGNIMRKADMWYSISIFTVVGICDVLTLILLITARKKVKAASSHQEHRKRFNNEVRFFFQAFATSIVYMSITFSYHVVSYQMTTSFGVFMTTTFAWPMSNTCSGLMSIIFNSEVRRCLFSGTFLRWKVSGSSQINVFVQPSSKNY